VKLGPAQPIVRPTPEFATGPKFILNLTLDPVTELRTWIQGACLGAQTVTNAAAFAAEVVEMIRSLTGKAAA
jgi:hypothetical protein